MLQKSFDIIYFVAYVLITIIYTQKQQENFNYELMFLP